MMEQGFLKDYSYKELVKLLKMVKAEIQYRDSQMPRLIHEVDSGYHCRKQVKIARTKITNAMLKMIGESETSIKTKVGM